MALLMQHRKTNKSKLYLIYELKNILSQEIFVLTFQYHIASPY